MNRLFRQHFPRFFVGVLCLSLMIGLAVAQRRGGGGGHQKRNAEGIGPIYEVPKNTEDLSGKFIMGRIRFDVGMYAGYYGMHLGDGGYPWSHDYPGAGMHLMKIVKELSKVDAVQDKYEPIFSFEDPDLYKYPFVYLCEVGFMNLTDKEIQGMREYCLRGGFIIVDDFRGDYQFYNLRNHLKRAFPEYEMKKLDISHPIFNCFFSIRTLNVPPLYGGAYSGQRVGPPEFWGLEDSTGRLMMVIDYNYDVSDFWQWSDDPFAPIEETNESYKFGVNYIMYALTH
ncbi:MAG TPA: DUF4159 domain-containing protein [Blastocatellia bacterium]|nr:DUF4159 domain-containing protein [Blastocatellia bacterium]